MVRLLLRFAPMSLPSQIAKIWKNNILKKNETGKTLFWQQRITPMLLREQVRRNEIIEATESTTIVRKKVVLLGTALNL